MEGDESKLLALQGQSQISPEISAHFSENIEGFQQCVDDVLDTIEQDQNFSEMTAAIYDQKKSYLIRHLEELSRMHRLLADQHAHLLREVSKNCPYLIKKLHPGSSDSSSHEVARMLKPTQVRYPQNFTKPSNYVSLFMPDGSGFYLCEKEGSSDSGSEPSTSINKPPVPAVKDDALKVKETNAPKDLFRKISSLREEVVSLNKILQSLRDENAELKQEIEENVSDICLYTSEMNLIIKTVEQELEKSKEQNTTIQHIMAGVLQEKATDKVMYEIQIEELKSKHEAREKVRNAVINRLKDELELKCETVAGMEKTIDALLADKCTQHNLIQELHTHVHALQFENVRALPSFDNVERLIKELKLKVEELEREVDKQKEVISDST